MASAAYNAWATQVKSNGGRVTVEPRSNTPAAAYGDPNVWVPKVNAHSWPIPDAYSTDGRTAYYYAPPSLQAEIRSFGTATPTETTTGAGQLMNQWGIPQMFQSLSAYRNYLIIGGVVLAVVYLMGKRK